jgi:hypothetical protein
MELAFLIYSCSPSPLHLLSQNLKLAFSAAAALFTGQADQYKSLPYHDFNAVVVGLQIRAV